MLTIRASWFVHLLGARAAVLAPLRADAFERSGGVSFGGIQIGPESMLAVSRTCGYQSDENRQS